MRISPDDIPTSGLHDPLRSVFEQAAVGIGRIGLDGRFLEVNARYCEIVGYSAAELSGLTFQAITHPDDLEADLERARALLSGAIRTYTLEKRYVRKDGSFVWVNLTGSLARDAAGRPAHFVAVVEDVTARRRAEEALRESEQRLRLALAAGQMGTFEVDLPTGRVRLSEGASRLLGLPHTDLPRHVTECVARVHPDDLAIVVGAMQHGAEAGEQAADYRLLLPEGQVRWIHSRGEVERDDRGRAVRMRGALVDVTARRQAEEAVRLADRRKSEFLAELSHELRNPLTPIRNGLLVIDRAPPGSPQFERAKQVIRRQTEHLARLVDDLLDLTRISHGKITLEVAPIDAGEVVRRACEDARSFLESRGLELATALPPTPVWIHADETRLAQIVGNLLFNAAKFTPRGGRVAASLGERGGRCELRVQDTGEGIEPELLERVFEPFEQVQRTRAYALGGVGLGLALVKRLVELHGGSVRAQSDGLGRGAELVVSLPTTPTPAACTAAPAPAVPCAGLRILIAEDNGDAGDTLADLLRLQGHDAAVVSDGRSAVATARAGRPDVLICDIGLPDMSGYDVIRALRSDGASSPAFAIALTGYAQPDDLARALESGFDAHLAKPTPLEELGALLARAAARRAGPAARTRP